MDDALCGAETLEEAKELQRQLIAILKSAGMELQIISGNHSEFSQCLNEIYNSLDQMRPKHRCVRGPVKYIFSFKVDVKPSYPYKKRIVLSTIATLFDPLGLVGAVVSKAKMFMQKLWRLSIDSKDPLPNKVYSKWLKLLIRLESFNSINIE
ncbi:uncharacterized protein TNCV_378031 [Trichonephila clavipes]|nr:uncharacterized protein TNCV_378031 [Trichonephila clavipes]